MFVALALTAPYGFPSGEAVAQIGSSEPIWVTEEVLQRFNIPYAVGKTYYAWAFASIFSAFQFATALEPLPSQCAHWGTFPIGEGKALRAKQQFVGQLRVAGMLLNQKRRHICVLRKYGTFARITPPFS